MRHKLLLLISFIFLFSFGLKAQKQVVEGTVLDDEGLPLIGANIFFPQDSTGTVTDINGKFRVEKDIDYYVVSYTGFETQKVQKPFPSIVELKSDPIDYNFITIIPPKYLIPHSYTEVSKDDIQRIPTVTLQEMYNKTPGIYMHAGALNTNRLTIRGIGARSPFSTQKIRAFINDIPITNGLGESNLEDINLGIIDNINVIKGPAAPEYGSALGGTILYNTNRNIRQKDQYKGLFEYGSFNTFHGNVNANFSKGNTVFSLNQDFLSSDGYRDNNNVLRYNLSGYSSTVWNNDVLTVFVNHTNLSGEIPSSINLEDFENDPSSAAANWEGVNGGEKYNRQMIGLNHIKEIKETWSSSVSLFFNRLASDERRPFNTAVLNSANFGGRYVLRYGLNNQTLNVKAGVEYFQDNETIDFFETNGIERGDFIVGNNETRFMGNAFLIAAIPWKKFMLEMGVSANSIFYNYHSETQSEEVILDKFYAPIISPHLSISYRPRSNQLYFFNLSQGHSAPSLQSSQNPLDFYFLNLEREVGFNAEVGTRIDIKGYELEAAVYSFLVNDLVILENVGPDLFESRNAGQTLHPGIEFSGNKKWILSNNIIGLQTSYQYLSLIHI